MASRRQLLRVEREPISGICPGWTPLFGMVADIVTREYGVPAVLGTGVVTKRIQDGQTITVDSRVATVELQVGD